MARVSLTRPDPSLLAREQRQPVSHPRRQEPHTDTVAFLRTDNNYQEEKERNNPTRNCLKKNENTWEYM